MKVAVTFPDPMAVVASYLRTQFPTTPVAVHQDGTPKGDLLLVRSDGPTQLNYPVSAFTPVRVIAWGSNEFQARALANRALTVLATFQGNADARSFGDFTGPDTATDPVSGRDLAYIIVTVRQRPVAV